MKSILCLVVILAACGIGQSPAWAIPVVGSPLAMDTPVLAPAGGAQVEPAIAFDGTNYLVVWLDTRDLGPASLYGARVDKSGKVLDPTGFRITEQAGLASLAYGGGEFLVAWSTPEAGIACARLDGSGKLIEATPIVLTTTGGGSASPGVVWNGSEFLVVWEDWRAKQADIYGARVAKTGVVLDPAGIAISTSKGGHRSPSIASDGTGFLVAWMDDRVNASQPRVFGARVAADGTVRDAQGLNHSPSDHEQFYPKVCFEGGNYQLAWEDVDASGATTNGMRGALVSPAGTSVATELVFSSSSTNSSLASACGKAGALVAWAGGSTRVDTAGRALDPTGLLSPPPTIYGANPAVASDGTDYLMVFNDPSGGRFLVATTVTAMGIVASPTGTKMFKASNTQLQPAIVRGANGYLAVMLDDRSGVDRGLYSIPLDNNGAPTGAATLITPRAYLSAGMGQLGLAWNGSHYLVAWQNNSSPTGIQMFRLDGGGKPLGPVALSGTSSVSAGAASTLGLVSDGNQFLLAWTDYRNTPPKTTPVMPPSPNPDIYAARIGDDGTMLDTSGLQIAGGTAQQTSPGLGFDGTNFLVVWNEGGVFRGTRIDKAGTILDAKSLVVGTASNLAPPTIVWGKSAYLIAWLGSAGPMGRRMDGTGSFLDANEFAIAVAPPSVNARSLTTAWDGQSFLVAWSGASGANGFAFGARVGADGSRLDSTGFAIEPPITGENSGQSAYPSQIGLASDGNGHWVSIADRYDSTAGVEVVRVRSRLITDCTGAQCPALPDGGIFPLVDAGATEARLLDAKLPEDASGMGANDTSLVRLDGPGSLPETGTLRDTAVAPADAATTRDGAVAYLDGGVAVPNIDAASVIDANSVTVLKTNSQGCGCKLGAGSGGKTAIFPWAMLSYAFLLWKTKRRRF